MSAAKGTLDADSGLLGQEDAPVDESKLSWLERRKLKKQRKALERKRRAAEKEGVIHDLVMDDIEIGEDFEELDTYPVRPPFSYVRVLFDKRDYSRFYYVVEPKASKQELDDLHTIKEVLQRALNIDRDTMDESQEDFLKQAVDDILNSYRLKSRKSNREKIHYFIEFSLISLSVCMRNRLFSLQFHAGNRMTFN